MAKILFVDDRAINRQFLRTLLGYGGGYELLEAEDGSAALEVAAAEHPDLIITDVMMPKMDGLELARRIRANDRLKAIPIIFYTATYRLKDAHELAAAHEVQRVLAKPSDPQVILNTVAEVLAAAAPGAGAGRSEPALGRSAYHGTADAVGDGVSGLQSSLRGAVEQGMVLAGKHANHVQLNDAFGNVQALSLRLSALIELGLEMAARHEPESLTQLCCRSMQDIMGARYVVVCIADGDGPRHIATRGVDEAAQAGLWRIDPQGGIFGSCLATGKLCRMAAPYDDAAALGLPAALPPAGHAIVVPIRLANKHYGWIYLADKAEGHAFDDTDEQFALTIATQFSLAYENLSSFEQLKQQSARIVQMSKTLAVLSGINAAIARIRNRRELLQEACRIAVEHGAFNMAWIGEAVPGRDDGRIVAWHGAKDGVLRHLSITAAPDGVAADRPASIAAREQRVVICNDIANGPAMSGFREALLADGHRAVGAFPIHFGESILILTLFAGQAGFFDDEELKRLGELAADITFGLQNIAKDNQLHYLACYDALTGLPNSFLFTERVGQLLALAESGRERPVLLMLDLDRFTNLNDLFGRHVGDSVLKHVGNLLNKLLTQSHNLARVSADTFAIALTGLSLSDGELAQLPQRILDALSQPVRLHGHELRLSAHIGISVYPSDGTDAATLFKNAEAALKRARESSVEWFFYRPDINASAAAQLALERELRAAIEENQFLVHYQPKVDLHSGRIIAAEALIRWKHPERGIISPASFIQLAEEIGLIVPIGAEVLRNVCAQQAAWRTAQVPIVPVAVNVSAIQLKRGGVLELINDLLTEHGLEPRCLQIELTESAIIHDAQEAATSLRKMREAGLKLSLDDFGTGYSSLVYLKRFSFDLVKIDRAFISDITHNADDAAIAKAVIAMAHQLNMRVLAEGVETEGQLRYLREHGCDEIQGYYFSKPVPASEFETMLREHRQLA